MSEKEKNLEKESSKEVLNSAIVDVEEENEPAENDALVQNTGSNDVLTPSPLDERGTVVSASNYSNSSMGSKYPNAREISETFSTKFKEMTFCGIAVAVNCILIWFFYQLHNGMNVPLSLDSVTRVGAVIIEIVLLIANVLTIIAMDDGCAAYFGFRLTNREGYSLAVCGFQQTSPVFKFSFCNQLSLNSTCRKLLSRLAIVWIVAEVLKVLTPVPATALRGTQYRTDSGTVNCIEYGQLNTFTDRKWPTVQVQAGIAELIFGTAIGFLRSERTDINVTTAIMSKHFI
jgi:hypothetical protein